MVEELIDKLGMTDGMVRIYVVVDRFVEVEGGSKSLVEWLDAEIFARPLLDLYGWGRSREDQPCKS